MFKLEPTENWKVLSLKDVADRIKEKNKSRSKNVLTISAQHGLVSQTEFFNKSVASKNLDGYLYIENGDFAYNKSYSEGYPFGAIKRLERYDSGVLSTLYICFRPKADLVDSDFLKFFFDSSLWHGEVGQIAKEGGRSHGLLNVGISEFFDVKIKIPPFKEQQKIAEILSSVDEAIEKTEAIIKQTETVKKGLMQQLLTKGIGHTEFKQTEIGEIPARWQVKKLNDVVDFLDERRKPIKKSDRDKMKGIIPYYGASGIIDWVNDFLFDEPLVLLSEDGENIRSRVLPIAFKVEGKCWINNHAHVLKPLECITISYLEHCLEFLDYEKYITGSAQPKLNQKVCKSILIPLPSKEEQQEIASIINSIILKKGIEINKLSQLYSLKQSLMQTLLTGKVRVNVEQPEVLV